MRRFAVRVWYGGVVLLGIGIFLSLIGIVSSAYIILFEKLSAWLGFWLCQRGGKLWKGNKDNGITARKLKYNRLIISGIYQSVIILLELIKIV